MSDNKCPKCRTTDFESCHSMYCPMRTSDNKPKSIRPVLTEDEQKQLDEYFNFAAMSDNKPFLTEEDADQLRKEFDEHMMSNLKPFTPDSAFEWFELKITEVDRIGLIKTVEKLLDKLDNAMKLLKEAEGGSFNSNLGARIKSFLSGKT